MDVITEFNRLYLDIKHPWTETSWLGQQIAKNPMDCWMYQEILTRTKPDILIETGSCIGGSAYFFASIMELIDHGHVVTIDKDHYPNQPKHHRITYLHGDSVDGDSILEINDWVANGQRAMVVLDSDHTERHVLKELDSYANLVAPGCYCVVEDTRADDDVNGAGRAVASYLASHPGQFDVDRECERHLLTFNPGGWLKRRA